MIFLDSDVLLDVALKRNPWYVQGADLLKLAYYNHIEIATSPIVLSNVHYMISSGRDILKAELFIKNALTFCVFLSHEKEDFVNAFQSKFKDKEDAINYFTARRHGIESMITRNIRDFKRSEIPVLTPSEYLARIAR